MNYIIRACCAAVVLWFAVGEAAALPATNLTLHSSENPSAFGDFVNFFVLLDGGSAGTVQFMDGQTNLGEPSAVQPNYGFAPPLSDAGVRTSVLSPGTHLITAVYSGDAQHAPATATLTQVVKVAAQPASVPALSFWQTALLALLICVAGVAIVRRIE